MASDKGKTASKSPASQTAKAAAKQSRTSGKKASQAAKTAAKQSRTSDKAASQAAKAAARKTTTITRLETSKNKRIKSEHKKSSKNDRVSIQNRRQLGNTGIHYGIVKTRDGGTRTWWDTGKPATSGHSTTRRRGNRVEHYVHQPNKAPAKGWSYNPRTKNTSRIRGK